MLPAAPDLFHDLLAQDLAQALRQHAPGEVGRAAGREAANEPDGMVGISRLRLRVR
jgi:hypothetical protein